MADKNKRSGLEPRASDTENHGFERVVIGWFDSVKGVGFLSRDGGPEVAFSIKRASPPSIGKVPISEPVFVRFSPDRKHVIEIRRMETHRQALKRADDSYARFALGEETYALDEASRQLAQDALKKAAGNRTVVDERRPHDEIAKESDANKIVPVPGTPEQKDESRLNEPLLYYLKAKNIPPVMWSDISAEIERLVGKKLAAAVARPLWDERAQYPSLANLSAPEFLKRVWADQIDADGTIEKELVRQNDRSLMGKVDNYIATRQRRRQDAGDAEGLRFIARRTRPKAKRRT